MQKHRTKIIALPTKIQLIPLVKATKEEIRKYLLFYKNEEGKFFLFTPKQQFRYEFENIRKVKGEIRIKNDSPFIVTNVISVKKDTLFLAYLENKLGNFASLEYRNIKIIEDCLSNNKLLDTDLVVSQGMDFTYEQPYEKLVIQDELNFKNIELRKQFADNPYITFYFEKDDENLFKKVQELLVKKYDVKGEENFEVDKNGRLDKKGYKEWKILDKFPFKEYKHLKEPIVYTYLYLVAEPSYCYPKPKIQMFPGYKEIRYIGSMYRKDLGVKVESVKQIDEFMANYTKYIKKVLPKQVNL